VPGVIVPLSPGVTVIVCGPPGAALALDNPTTLSETARKPVKTNLANFEVLEGEMVVMSWSVIVLSLAFD
jgi:hypothetical protein